MARTLLSLFIQIVLPTPVSNLLYFCGRLDKTVMLQAVTAFLNNVVVRSWAMAYFPTFKNRCIKNITLCS